MTQQEWADIDASSRCIVSALLSAAGAVDISEMAGNCCVDISCHLNGKNVCVEIKDRTFPSDRYGDILVEDLKQERTAIRIADAQFDIALAANVYTDSIIALANLFDKDAKHFAKYAPTTTLVRDGDHTYVKKDFCSLPQRKKYKFSKVPNGGYVFAKL